MKPPDPDKAAQTRKRQRRKVQARNGQAAKQKHPKQIPLNKSINTDGIPEHLQSYNQTPLDLHADQNLLTDLASLHLLWNPPPSPFQNDPIRWVHEVAHVETWSKQDEIYRSVQNHRYTAVKSCHGPGKSFTGAHVVAWWLNTKPDAFAVTSAPTSHQVRTILWREIRRAQLAAHLPGKITNGQVPEWKAPDGEVIAFGRKPADYLDPTTASAAFQGIHATNLLVVLDEGSGIPEWLASACENLITNEDSRLLIIGNPDNPTSYFAKAFRPGTDFHKITITAFDTPAFTGEPVSTALQKRLTSKVWVEERKKRWGENSPMYKAKVLAEFPDVTDDTVFTPQMINDAILNDRSAAAVGKGRYGFDVARLGPDDTVIYHNRNGYCRMVARWAKLDTMASVGRFRRIAPTHKPSTPTTIVDATGLGAGVYDRLKELGYPVIPFNGGEKAFNPLKYKNRRSEAYWEARQMFEEGLIDIDPEDEDLQAELYEVHFQVDSTGRIQIESKEDIAERLGHSPDKADAFIYSLQMQADISTMAQNNQVLRQAIPDAAHEQELQSEVSTTSRPVFTNHNGHIHKTDIDDPTADIMEVEF